MSGKRAFKLIIFDWDGTLVESTPGPTQLLPQVLPVLQQLSQQGYLLAIATAKSKRGLRDDLLHTKLAPLIDFTCTAEESAPKPNPMMLFDILNHLNVAAHEAVMVGDTLYDLEMAKHAKMSAIAVTYGGHSAAQLQVMHPLTCLAGIHELTPWLAAYADQLNSGEDNG